jgi:sarcosine oxidase, subunit beta
MSESADVVVIGAGILGTAITFELARRGYRCITVEKNAGAALGASGSSSACVRAHFRTRPGVVMAYEGFHYWADWRNYLEADDESGTARYVRCGTIMLKGQDERYITVSQHYRDVGVPYEDWDLDALRKRVPYYDLRAFWPPRLPGDSGFWAEPQAELAGALFTPGSGYVADPQLAAHNLQRAAEARGAIFLFRREVREIRSGSRVTGVTLADGSRVDAPVVVNAAGTHSGRVNQLAGVAAAMRISTRPQRHEVHIVPAPDGLDVERDGIHTSDGDLGIYFRPNGGNTILVGSESPPCDRAEWVADPDHFERRVSQERWEAQVYRLARRIPAIRVPHVPRGLSDLYDVSDDGIPLYDQSDLPGFYMAIGTSGSQFKNAPVVGHLMAELIGACEAGHDQDAHPLQVRTRYTGQLIDSGYFSRWRSTGPDSRPDG